jgi:hypothetical protein
MVVPVVVMIVILSVMVMIVILSVMVMIVRRIRLADFAAA